jgi:hypothetical protein
VKLEIVRLRDLHPRMPAGQANIYHFFASAGLSRGNHRSGVRLHVTDGTDSVEATLHFSSFATDALEQLDNNRITEDAAEAIALVFVGVAKKWQIRRRLQREESADWLLRDGSGTSNVALEISGIAEGKSDEARIRRKVEQVGSCLVAAAKAACVVELSVPWTKLRFAP